MSHRYSFILILLLAVVVPVELQARNLNPNLSRFQTMDSYEGTTRQPQSLHKYNYCAANPVNQTDPSGQFGIDETMAGLTIYVALAVLKYDYARASYALNQRENAIVDIAKIKAAYLTQMAIFNLDDDEQLYTRWFGTPTPARKAVVEGCYEKILEDLNGKITWHHAWGPANLYAYVYPGGPVEIWFGPLFWTASDNGSPSKGGVVVHELSHEVGVTLDTSASGVMVYGPAASKALAASDPDTAVHHADCYRLFAEEAE